VSALCDFDVVEYRADELSVARLTGTKKVAILVVGGDSQPLRSVLPALRASMPNLPVVALAGSLDRSSQNFYRNHVDGIYTLPADADKLALVASFDNTGVPSRWKLLIKEKAVNGLIAAIVLLGIWWLAVVLFRPPPYLLPAPGDVIFAFYSQASRFISHLTVTAYEAILGFAIGNSLGIAIAISLHRYVGLKKFTLPVLISFQAIPIVALAPLLVVWFGTGLISKVTMAAIICFFPMVVNALQAFSNVDRDYVELFEFYRAGFAEKLRMLLMPASFPAIVSALKISAGLSVVGAIVAELTGADRGLGYILLNASYRLETDTMFVAMLLSAVLGMLFFQMPAMLRFVVPKSWSIALK
jgi:ABC-type nitrate/sulfonate/bicarbonate transport system permease component